MVMKNKFYSKVPKLRLNFAHLQFSLLHKEENAHDNALWACAWGRDPEPASAGDENTPPEEANPFDFDKKEPKPNDFIVTGGLDDLVKVWDLREDNTLKLRHQLKGHALGVVSVAVSSDGQSKWSEAQKKRETQYKHTSPQPLPAARWIPACAFGTPKRGKKNICLPSALSICGLSAFRRATSMLSLD